MQSGINVPESCFVVSSVVRVVLTVFRRNEFPTSTLPTLPSPEKNSGEAFHKWFVSI